MLILGNFTWYIIEVELSEHDYYSHIVPQIAKFKDSISNPNTRKKLIEIFYAEIQKNEDFRKKADKIRKEKELHKILTDIINKPPEIIIIIDRKKREFEGNPELRVLEFTTFFSITDDNYEKVHIFDTFIDPEINEIYEEIEDEGLNQILEVTELILKYNKDYSEAANIVASKKNVHSNTVKDKCTRRLGLYTEDFLNHIKDIDKFIELLSVKFPEYEKIIRLRLSK